ncbi:hypothetical protein D9M69_652660 [compost metagenome]
MMQRIERCADIDRSGLRGFVFNLTAPFLRANQRRRRTPFGHVETQVAEFKQLDEFYKGKFANHGQRPARHIAVFLLRRLFHDTLRQ